MNKGMGAESALVSALTSPFTSLLNSHAQTKQGGDPIFYWFSRSIKAKSEGHDVVNGTLGSLLCENGTLMVNQTVDKQIRQQPERELCGYAPLKGLPVFRDLAIDLALGGARSELDEMGISMTGIATPGGCGALAASAANFIERGDDLLLRSRHWGPYKTIIHEQNCGFETWPLLPAIPEECMENFDRPGFASKLSKLAASQPRLLIWLNDPAHNPTGLSLNDIERSALLDELWEKANEFPETGFTMLIDSAYSLYSADPYAWADSLKEKMSRVKHWPSNLMFCFAISCSKSHTVYGLRTGALVCLHPEEEFIENVSEVILHTGRGTWSAAPRVAQRAISEIHNREDLLENWANERDQFKLILSQRRAALQKSIREVGLELNPNHDGYFAFFECENNQQICEIAATEHNVYLVPLEGGIRIGVCAIPADKMGRVATALAHGLAKTR